MSLLIIIAVIILILLSIYMWWRFLYFFRDPERKIPEGKNIVSPADGTIVYIKEIRKGQIPIAIKKGKEITLEEIVKYPYPDFQEGYIIGIFMSLLSVHVNRAPIEGMVEKIVYFESKNISMKNMFFNVLFKKKPFYKNCEHILQNERNTIIINGIFRVAVVQIADVVVDKIECWVEENQKVAKGEKIGMIKMGSQVDIIISKKCKINILVNEGDYVYAGQTLLATY